MSIDTTLPQQPELGDDAEWEDVPDVQHSVQEIGTTESARATPTPTSTPATPRSTARRRKTRKTISIAQQQQTPRRLPQAQPLVDIDGAQVQEALVYGVASSVRYFGSVFTHAFQMSRRPLGFLLCLWMLAFLLAQVSDVILRPVCRLPLISSTSLCTPPRPAKEAQWADYPSLVEIQSNSFEPLIDGTISGSALSLDIKQAEMATRDLVTLVKVSDLKSRQLIAESLAVFIEDAKKASRRLHSLNAKINGAVDKIVAANDHALRTIEDAQDKPNNALVRVIWPFGHTSSSQIDVVESFRNSMDVNASEMAKLIVAVELALEHLDTLDERLDALHELCARENLTVSAARDQLLSELWTILGGNRKQLRKFTTNLELLQALGEYRKRARAHVAAAMQTLEGMGEDMEDLRERVAAPEIVGDRIPIEVHMKSIQSGMERLKEQRLKAKEREEQLMDKILGINAA
ncbi:hypothetical protein C8Q80DRAFT_1269537 [Daedaleopsis nitida]|nr:hypothetical protein C8Q80DRAFT_1269537 [Daedaleopsis nitida]